MQQRRPSLARMPVGLALATATAWLIGSCLLLLTAIATAVVWFAMWLDCSTTPEHEREWAEIMAQRGNARAD